MAGIDSLFGPMLIGVFFNTMLYGACLLIVQTYTYYQTRKNDSKSPCFDYLVLYLLFMETLNTGFDIVLIYEPLILRYGTEEAVKFVPLMLIADPVVMALISTPIQLFFAWRVSIITKSKLIVASILFLPFVHSVSGGIAATIATAVIREFARLQELKGAIITWLFSSAIADIIITTSLLVNLYRKKTGTKATNDVVNKIMRFTLQTGLLTSIFASLDAILFLAIPDTAYNFALDFPLSKLYTNSLLSSLNARREYRNELRGFLSLGDITGSEVSLLVVVQRYLQVTPSPRPVTTELGIPTCQYATSSASEHRSAIPSREKRPSWNSTVLHNGSDNDLHHYTLFCDTDGLHHVELELLKDRSLRKRMCTHSGGSASFQATPDGYENLLDAVMEAQVQQWISQ
ncbi:hypothetical protein EYR36_011981 [Pleurotus pulmonarius]|nr:hypothetical protein EYR36_011981 [Pleurotus pulmonarius]